MQLYIYTSVYSEELSIQNHITLKMHFSGHFLSKKLYIFSKSVNFIYHPNIIIRHKHMCMYVNETSEHLYGRWKNSLYLGFLPLETDLYPNFARLRKCCLFLWCLTLGWDNIFAPSFSAKYIMTSWRYQYHYVTVGSGAMALCFVQLKRRWNGVIY